MDVGSDPSRERFGRNSRDATWRLVGGVALVALVLTACGTRVPNSDFEAALRGDTAGAQSPDLGVDGDAGTEGALPEGGGGPAAGPEGSEGGGGDDVGGAGPEGATGNGGTSREGTDSGGEGANGESGNDGSDASVEDNVASDVGVTEDTIRVGNLVSLNGPLGQNAFGPSYFGANAYFTYLNQAQDGVHGRTIEFEMCDDAEDGSRNLQCAQDLVENQKVFAFVANSTRAYAAAEYVSEQGVPDILGQPIGNEYWTYPTLYGIRGGLYPRDGEVGHDGNLYGGTLAYRFIRDQFDADTAAVFFFDVPISRAAGQHFADGLEHAGFEVQRYEVNPVAPNFEARVQQMQEAGVEVIFDTMDVNANRNLCQAMDDNGFQVEAKVTTTQGMGRGIGNYSHPCRESVVAISESLPYSEPGSEEVELFQDVMSRVYGGQFDDNLAQWAWEGWLAARTFTEAVESMGPKPTREGLMAYFDGMDDYTAGGLLTPIDWQPLPFGETDQHEQCLTLSQWNEDRSDFERISPMPLCDPVTWLPWSPA